MANENILDKISVSFYKNYPNDPIIDKCLKLTVGNTKQKSYQLKLWIYKYLQECEPELFKKALKELNEDTNEIMDREISVTKSIEEEMQDDVVTTKEKSVEKFKKSSLNKAINAGG